MLPYGETQEVSWASVQVNLRVVWWVGLLTNAFMRKSGSKTRVVWLHGRKFYPPTLQATCRILRTHLRTCLWNKWIMKDKLNDKWARDWIFSIFLNIQAFVLGLAFATIQRVFLCTTTTQGPIVKNLRLWFSIISFISTAKHINVIYNEGYEQLFTKKYEYLKKLSKTKSQSNLQGKVFGF